MKYKVINIEENKSKVKIKKKAKEGKAKDDFKLKSLEVLKRIEIADEPKKKRYTLVVDPTKHAPLIDDLKQKEDLKTGIYDLVKKEIKVCMDPKSY